MYNYSKGGIFRIIRKILYYIMRVIISRVRKNKVDKIIDGKSRKILLEYTM